MLPSCIVLSTLYILGLGGYKFLASQFNNGEKISFRFLVLSVNIPVPRFGIGLNKNRFIEKPPKPITHYDLLTPDITILDFSLLLLT